jgi:hypothetical protein
VPNADTSEAELVGGPGSYINLMGAIRKWHFFLGARDQTHDFTYARQMLYLWTFPF